MHQPATSTPPHPQTPAPSLAAPSRRRRIENAVLAAWLAFSGLFFFAVSCFFIFTPPPAMAACNPATVENCCVSNATSECEAWLSHSGATGVLVRAECGLLTFTLLGKYDATNLVKHTTSWTSLNPQQFTCDPDSVSFTTNAVPPTVDWVIMGPDDATNVWATGSGSIAISPSGAVSRVKCTFLLADIAQGSKCPTNQFSIFEFGGGDPCEPGELVDLSPMPQVWCEELAPAFALDLSRIGIHAIADISWEYFPHPPKICYSKLYLDKCCPNGVWGSYRKDSERKEYAQRGSKTLTEWSLSGLLPVTDLLDKMDQELFTITVKIA